MLKKTILISAVVLALVSAAIAAEKTADCAVVIYSKGLVKVSAAGYETGKDSSLALMAGQVRIDLLPDSKTSPASCSPSVNVKLLKGSAWVRCGRQKAVISSGVITLESSASVFQATTNNVSVYSGFVTIKNSKKITRVGRSMSYDFVSGKITNISDEAAGNAARQINMDKFNLYCVVNLESGDFITARSTFAGAFTAFYHAGKVLFSFDNSKEDYDLNMDLKMAKKSSGYALNGIIKNALTGETVSIFSVDEAADADGAQRAMTKAGIETARALQSYGSKVLTEGTTVFVEMEGHNDKIANEIKGILEKNPSVSNLKYTDFQGKKALYEISFKGNGYDLSEILDKRKVQNKHINIWKNSKFVVKLTII